MRSINAKKFVVRVEPASLSEVSAHGLVHELPILYRDLGQRPALDRILGQYAENGEKGCTCASHFRCCVPEPACIKDRPRHQYRGVLPE